MSQPLVEQERDAVREVLRRARRYIRHDPDCASVEMKAKGAAVWPCSCGAADVLELADRLP